MKTLLTPLVIALICIMPTLIQGQVLQAQDQKPVNNIPLRALQVNSMQSMAGPPLIRVSNIGSSGQDGVRFELNSLSLTNPGPTLLFGFPPLGSTGSGNIKVQPKEGKPGLIITNLGSSGQDGISLKVSSPPVPTLLDSFFDVFYNLKTHTETHSHGITGDPDFDLLRIISYDRITPKLGEKIMSANPIFATGFFDITYELPTGIIGTGFGNTPENLCSLVQYDKATPKLAQRITSDAPTAHGFFDISYDLNLGSQTVVHGDPDFDLLRTSLYNKNSRKLKDSIYSHNAMTNSFFDITYDLGLGSTTVVHGDPDFDLLRTSLYNINSRKLKDSIYSHNALANSFFDISYDLGLGSTTVVHGDPDFDLLRTSMYNINSRKLKDSIYSHNGTTNSFFDIEYDLGLGTLTQTHGDPDFDLLVTRTFNKTTPMLQEKIYSRLLEEEGIFYTMHDLHNAEYSVQYNESEWDFVCSKTFDVNQPKVQEKLTSNNPMANGQFQLYFDLRLGKESRAFRGIVPGDPDFDLIHVRNYDRGTPKLQETISSSNPILLNSFFDVTYDLMARQYKVQFEDILITRSYDPLLPMIQERLTDVNSDNFMDIITSLDAGTETHVFGNPASDLRLIRTYDKTAHKLNDRILDSSIPASFFDITYDLGAQFYKVKFNDLLVTSYCTSTAPKFEQKISSSLLPYNDCFLTYISDLSDTHVQKHSTVASAAGGLMPLEMRVEYDANTRKVREVTTDLQTPAATLTLERRLSPTGSSLFVSNKLEIQGPVEVQGPVSTPGPAPLSITDNVIINGVAHQLIGNVQVVGNLNVSGTKAFKIDHPLDPDNKYLIHSCIESPDMMNVYNGNATTDEQGYVTITLPDYFEALNTDYRYQLTCIGQFAQAIIAEKIKHNHFIIRTDKPNVEVSWQVTGIRNDPGSKKSKFAVEMEKEGDMKGKRLYDQ